MAYTTRPLVGNYVVFVRVTTAQWALVPEASRDRNTLYFVSDNNAAKGALWLGNTLISDSSTQSITNLSELNDVMIENDIPTNAILTYKTVNGSTGWYPTELDDIFNLIVDTFSGATATKKGTNGLVPAPEAGQQDLYLKGDGTWADPTSEIKETLNGTPEVKDEDDNIITPAVPGVLSVVESLFQQMNTLNTTTIPGINQTISALEQRLCWQELTQVEEETTEDTH